MAARQWRWILPDWKPSSWIFERERPVGEISRDSAPRCVDGGEKISPWARCHHGSQTFGRKIEYWQPEQRWCTTSDDWPLSTDLSGILVGLAQEGKAAGDEESPKEHQDGVGEANNRFKESDEGCIRVQLHFTAATQGGKSFILWHANPAHSHSIQEGQQDEKTSNGAQQISSGITPWPIPGLLPRLQFNRAQPVSIGYLTHVPCTTQAAESDSTRCLPNLGKATRTNWSYSYYGKAWRSIRWTST